MNLDFLIFWNKKLGCRFTEVGIKFDRPFSNKKPKLICSRVLPCYE